MLFATYGFDVTYRPIILVALWASGREPTSINDLYTRGTLGVYAHAQLLMSATPVPPHLSDYQFYTVTHVHSLQGNVCNCNRVPQCIYEMSVEKVQMNTGTVPGLAERGI